MTPQDKAKELIRKYYSIGAIECKKCALIAVDEVWRQLEAARVFEDYDYWQEVKQELKNYIPTNNA